MEGAKAWWMSKTIWANAIALIGSVVLAVGFDPGRWAEISTVALAAVNVALRFYTKEEIALQPTPEQ
ncbi:MAG: hypothetical protein HY912_02925 [Desulfomonile tiedjei]|uniref:Uncharacterized protein n=1 Tax=Desulfomonile tiedjei TaxID=2358 RepID=A0A9D6V0G2_9BACT|nr:hypothetical protein [Desulfomonile tiedjei]